MASCFDDALISKDYVGVLFACLLFNLNGFWKLILGHEAEFWFYICALTEGTIHGE